MLQQVITRADRFNNTRIQQTEEAKAENTDETRPVAASGPNQQLSGLQDALNVFKKAVDQSDWALLHLPLHLSTKTNLKEPRNPWFKTVTVGTADDLVQGDVSVLFYDLPISGVLRKSMSTILCEGRTYDVQLIFLNDVSRRQ